MLVTLLDVIGCENPDCREFACIISRSGSQTSYYCPVCGSVTKPRAVDAELASSREDYEAYLREALAGEDSA